MNEFQIGAVHVSRIEEWQGAFLSPAELFVGYEQDSFSVHQDNFSEDIYVQGEDRIYAFLQSWLLRVGDLKIIYDTGAGNEKERPGLPLFSGLQTDFLDKLKAAGYAPEDIDIVICSHLHIDHVGWNTRLEGQHWRPTFPNARYLFSARDIEFWDPANAEKFPGQIGREVNQGCFEDSVQPIIDAGKAEIISGPFELLPGLLLEPAPGHTPGHMVLKIVSNGEYGIFTGDIIHHPIQIYYPNWNSIFCEQAEQARSTRHNILSYAAEKNALVFPAHFGGQHAVWVTTKENGYGIADSKPV